MKAFIIALLATALAGCGTVGSVLEAANGGIAGLTITQVTVRYIENESTPEARYQKAQRVKAVTAELRAAASGELVTVEGLKALAESKLPADMAIADRLLALELIGIAATVIEKKVGEGVIDPADLPNLDALLRRIEFAAAYFPAP